MKYTRLYKFNVAQEEESSFQLKAGYKGCTRSMNNDQLSDINNRKVKSLREAIERVISTKLVQNHKNSSEQVLNILECDQK